MFWGRLCHENICHRVRCGLRPSVGRRRTGRYVLPHQKLGFGNKSIRRAQIRSPTGLSRCGLGVEIVGAWIPDIEYDLPIQTGDPQSRWLVERRLDLHAEAWMEDHQSCRRHGRFQQQIYGRDRTASRRAHRLGRPMARTGRPLVSTWLGPCKPGQKGGDVIMSKG